MIALLKSIQKKNESRGLSGILLYADGNIIQVIEGNESTVNALFAKIETDPRHRGIFVLAKRFLDHRDFPNFGMGFVGLNKPDISEFENLFLENRYFPQAHLDGVSKRVTTFLKTFLKTAHVG